MQVTRVHVHPVEKLVRIELTPDEARLLDCFLYEATRGLSDSEAVVHVGFRLHAALQSSHSLINYHFEDDSC